MSGDEWLPIPRDYSPEAEAAMVAITARLRPIAESTTVRLVEVTYRREGWDTPLTKVVFDTHTVGRWRQKAPIEATHLTIEERDWPTRTPWRFDVPEVPAHVTAFEDAMRNVFVRDPDCPEHWYVHPAGHRWAPYRFRDLAVHCSLPLVECEDPRAAS